MAFLRQCLQELRARQGEQDAHFSNEPGWADAWCKPALHDKRPWSSAHEAVTEEIDRSLPAHRPKAMR